MNEVVEDFAINADLAMREYVIENILIRPFSVVYKIRIFFDNQKNRVYYAKYYKKTNNTAKDPGVIERDFKTTQYWYNRFKHHEKFKVIKPVYYSSEHSVLITEESKGANLSRLINRYGQFFPSLSIRQKLLFNVKLAGQWLNYFQSLAIEEDYEELTLEKLLEYITIRLERLVKNPKVSFDEKLREKVIAFVNEQWQSARKDDLKHCYLHSDLSLSNVLIFNNSVTVLDFNKKEVGSKFKDVARFYHQLALLENKPTFSKRFVHKLKTSFLEGYGLKDATEKPLFKVYYIIHMINHLNKSSRYWEHNFFENLYNRWIVWKSLKEFIEQ